ncbi:MAG: lysophospholipid acyltransferase family protein [Capsulimonadales bacterium]|nr:lysophospholipid acyltransferase family protein [Capsulimonadales bacterium]
MGGPKGQEFGRSGTRRWQRFVVAALRVLSGRLQRMPRSTAMLWGRRLGEFAHFTTRTLVRRTQRYAHRNLCLTEFPHENASTAERDGFIRRVYIQFAKSGVDFLRGPALNRAELDRIVRADGWQYAEEARKAGKGTIFITAHLGNWEMLGRWLAAHGIDLTVVAREPEEPAFAEFIHELRLNAGFKVAYRGDSARELLRLLKANRAIGLLPDQNSGDVFVPFFGVPAGTAVGPAALALHTGAALIPSYCVRLPDDTYRLLLLPPIDTRSTGNREADQLRITTEVNRVLETVIRDYPDQWLWLHNRWKSAFEEGNRTRAWPNGRDEAAVRRWNGDTAERHEFADRANR